MRHASKFLSLLLRHAPETIGVTLDQAGWAQIDELIDKSKDSGHNLSLELIQEIIRTSDKARFELSPDQLRVRAFQGHSIAVDLKLAPASPPALLYHGTAQRFIASIQLSGLLPQQRQHVHLSADLETAKAVGLRYAKNEKGLVILTIDAVRMALNGCLFFQAGNGVWLTNSVPAEYISGFK